MGAVTESGRRKKQGGWDLSTRGDASASHESLPLGFPGVPERVLDRESTQSPRITHSDQKQLPHPIRNDPEFFSGKP